MGFDAMTGRNPGSADPTGYCRLHDMRHYCHFTDALRNGDICKLAASDCGRCIRDEGHDERHGTECMSGEQYRARFGSIYHERQDTDMAKTTAPPLLTASDRMRVELRQIEEQEAHLLRRKEELLRKAERHASRPSEPRIGSTVTFTVQFDEHDTVYKYAALRIGNKWYTTGGARIGNSGGTWHALLDLMELDVSVKAGITRPIFYVTTKTEKVTW